MDEHRSADFEIFSFYKFVPIQHPAGYTEEHRGFCRELGLAARVLIAEEGINGVISGPAAACQQYRQSLLAIPEFSDLHFKIARTDQPYLQHVRVKHKNEIVNSGLQAIRENSPLRDCGPHLSPARFKEMKDRSDVIILDVRSAYETAIGRFKNAHTLPIQTFREFPEYLDALEPYKHKKVLTYCTGGIKCEKATALLKARGFQEVYQLEGGILNYAKEEAGEDFDGKCYVFDERVTVDVNQVNPSLISHCLHCGEASARVINCANAACHQQIVMCEACGWQWDGCCSRECMDHPLKRPYDGTGYYPRRKVQAQNNA